MRSNGLRQRLKMAAAAAVLATAVAACTGDEEATPHPVGPAVESLREFRIRSSEAVAAQGRDVARHGFVTDGWLRASVPSTVMGALVGPGGYPDLFHSTNMRERVDPAQFRVPWWYRAEFVQARDAPGHVFVRIPGVISRGDVWVNGMLVGEVVGAYNDTEFDITAHVRPGPNVLAVLVHPADVQRDLVVSFIDWAQHPPDTNMGIWRDVELRREGRISLRDPFVRSRLSLPDMRRADLTVSVDVRNNDAEPAIAVIAGEIGSITFKQVVRLAGHETRTVTFSPSRFPKLRVRNPRVWWPADLGAQPLYHLRLRAGAQREATTEAAATFGIRDVRAEFTAAGDRQFIVNGTRLLIRAAGWAPDLFLRHDAKRLEAELAYARHLGLNAIRMEGKLEHEQFYDVADRHGLLLLPGWECCSKWESWYGFLGDPWTAQDREIARRSISSQARRLRNHPSVLSFLLGSDIAPPTDIQHIYLDELAKAGWPHAIDLAATKTSVAPFGTSGMQFGGPYDWVPPTYWYEAAIGFGPELSGGNSIPPADDLAKMLSPPELEQLWRDPTAKQYHIAYGGDLERFATALARRYGRWTSLAGFVERAQLANYESTRAQFEAYARNTTADRPATGTVYWMLNNAWPSLNWHLYDYYLTPAGSYFGAKKGNEPLHVQYSYDSRTVVIINRTRQPLRDATVHAEVYDLDGNRRYVHTAKDIDITPMGVTTPATIPPISIPDESRTYLVRLRLDDRSGHAVSRNTYWLSTQPDELDRSATNPGGVPWAGMTVGRYADLTGLATMPATAIDATVSVTTGAAKVTLRNRSPIIAVAVRVTLRQPDGNAVAPIYWNDNYVTLFPDEQLTLQGTYDNTVNATQLDIAGWNVKAHTVRD